MLKNIDIDKISNARRILSILQDCDAETYGYTSFETTTKELITKACQNVITTFITEGNNKNNKTINISDQNIEPHDIKNKSQTKSYNPKSYTISELVNEINEFRECGIRTSISKTVVYDGILDAPIMLIGEAPGEEEEARGIPFCGASGKLLDQMLSLINITRERNLYITNTVFWRPIANRKPTAEEVAICLPFIIRQIDIIKPRLIITCGSTALQALFVKNNTKITQITGTTLSYNSNEHTYTVIPILHPSYLLRQPMSKKRMWHDLLKIETFIANI